MSHARLGPSNHRWPHCPGSVREEAGYEDVAGAAAIDGTGSHLLLEMCLMNGVRADAYLGQIIGANDPENPMGWLVEEDRCERVQECLDYVSRRHRELTEQYTGCAIEVIAEGRSNPGDIYGRTDWWGTCDITINVHVDGECVFIEVCDYKDGRGWVHVPKNTQLISYLGGRLKPYIQSGLPREWMTVHRCSVPDTRITIVQPKTNPSVRYDDLNSSTVMGLMDGMAEAASKTDDPDAPVIAGKHCQWCKANPKRGGHCSAESSQSLKVVSSMSKDVIATDGQSLFELVGQSLDKVNELTEVQLTELMDAEAGFNAIFDKLRTEIQTRIEAGLTVPGYAMKPGRTSRVWSGDEADIVKALKGRRMKQDDIYPKKMLSVAQIMKSKLLTDKQKSDIETKFVTEKSGALSLTKVSSGDEAGEKDLMFADVIEDNVSQCETTAVQSAPSVFNDGMNPVEPEPKQPISFF